MDPQSASLFAYVAFDEPSKEILAHGPTATDALRSADKAASDAAIYILASEPLSVALSSSIHTYHENQSAGTTSDSMRQSGGVPKLSRGFSRWITLDALWQAAANAIEQFKQDECRNFFTHAGYDTTRSEDTLRWAMAETAQRYGRALSEPRSKTRPVLPTPVLSAATIRCSRASRVQRRTHMRDRTDQQLVQQLAA